MKGFLAGAIAALLVSTFAMPSARSQSAVFVPLWNGKHPNASKWTASTRAAIRSFGDDLMDGAGDIESFCPMYDRLGTRDRENFWIQLIAAITRYESNFKPATRYRETTMGTDPVTGRQVVSEGLLQLSYQDELSYRNKVPRGVCDFNYTADKRYAVTDLRRTILNTRNNLRCGVGILNYQISRYGKIAIGPGAYWAVIKSGSRYSRLTEIRRITRALDFCGG